MTKFHLLFPIIKKSCFFLLMALTFSACVVQDDEDDDIIEPVNEEVTFQVDLVKIAALEIGSFENDRLEVFGKITADLVLDNITENYTLWDKAGGNAISVGFSDRTIEGSATYTFSKSDLADAELRVRADLSEWDGSGSNTPENLGAETIVTSLENVTSTTTLEIVLNRSSEQHVKVAYAITRL